MIVQSVVITIRVKKFSALSTLPPPLAIYLKLNWGHLGLQKSIGLNQNIEKR
jgi:hypothetical protein